MNYIISIFLAIASFSVLANESITNLYQNWLQQSQHLEKGKITDFLWEKQKVQTNIISQNQDYNQTIYWLVDIVSGKPVMGFRPFYVLALCKSSCQIFVFHLAFTPDWSKVSLIQEKKKPLTKINHQLLSKEDISKLEHIALYGNSVLKSLHNPSRLIDPNSQNKQTNTFAKNVVIAGGAFTTYAIYKASLEAKLLTENSSNGYKKAIESQRAYFF